MENNTLTNNLPNLNIDTNFMFKGSSNSLDEIKNPKVGDVYSISKDKIKYETYVYIGNDWVLIDDIPIIHIEEKLNRIKKVPIKEELQEDQSYLDLGSKEIENLLRG